MLLSLNCSLLPLFSSSDEFSLAPTRTPLPTFTPTGVGQPLVSITPSPTLVLIPSPSPVPPTATVQAAPSEFPTDPPPTNTLELQPTEPPPLPTEPPPPPTEPPPPPEESDPASGPIAGANGVSGQIVFRDGRDTYNVGERVFVKIEVTNTSGEPRDFGILGLTASNGVFQTSWDNSSIGPGETFRHEDGLAFSGSGNHRLWLSICFSSKEECQGPGGNWERFEPGLDVVVQ